MKKQQTLRNYTTSDVCNMYGLSASGLRYLEEKGLISPEREAGSRYRVFTLRECSRLFLYRHLREYGFGMEQCVQLVLHGTAAAYHQSLEERAREIEEELRYKQALLASIRSMQAMLSHLRHDPPMQIIKSPAFYRLTVKGLEDASSFACSNCEDFQRWYNALPFTAASLLIDGSSLESDNLQFNFGFVIEAGKVQEHGLTLNENTDFLPSRRCMYTILHWNDNLEDISSGLRPAMEGLRAMGLTLAGDPFTRMFGSVDTGRGMERYDEAWFPIDE